MVAAVNLNDILKPEGRTRARAQIGAAQGDNLWVLSSGKLQRMEKVTSASVGPKLITAWENALELGSPLNACQVMRDRATGEMDLVFVTQELKRRVCQATAVRGDDGLVRWQRRLGLICQGAPLHVGPVLLALGQSGEVFAIDSTPTGAEDSLWRSAGRSLVAEPLDDSKIRPPLLLKTDSGSLAYEIAFPGEGNEMFVRRFSYDSTTRLTKMEEQQTIKLPVATSVAGTPVIVGNWIVVPLTNGVVFTVSLSPLGTIKKEGANWRSNRLGSDARCFITPLGRDRFVATDGSRGLIFRKINETGVMSGLLRSDRPDDEPLGTAPDIELDDRVAAAPLVLEVRSGEMQLLVADTSSLLRTIRVSESKAQEDLELRWNLHAGGNLTSGPFFYTPANRELRIGCVLDGRKFVWIDPRKAQSVLWTYETPGGTIVGEPQLAEDKIVIADQSGGIVALDPATGKPRGKGCSLPGSIAPTAPPVQFDADHLFTPLTDGTVVLLPLSRFR
jgi:hypothetical protein